MFKLACIYIVVSTLDLIVTTAIILTGRYEYPFEFQHAELNPLARIVLWSGGVGGLFVYKLFTVALVLLIVDTLSRRDSSIHRVLHYIKPQYILIFGIILTTLVSIFGVSYFVGL